MDRRACAVTLADAAAAGCARRTDRQRALRARSRRRRGCRRPRGHGLQVAAVAGSRRQEPPSTPGRCGREPRRASRGGSRGATGIVRSADEEVRRAALLRRRGRNCRRQSSPLDIEEVRPEKTIDSRRSAASATRVRRSGPLPGPCTQDGPRSAPARSADRSRRERAANPDRLDQGRTLGDTTGVRGGRRGRPSASRLDVFGHPRAARDSAATQAGRRGRSSQRTRRDIRVHLPPGGRRRSGGA